MTSRNDYKVLSPTYLVKNIYYRDIYRLLSTDVLEPMIEKIAVQYLYIMASLDAFDKCLKFIQLTDQKILTSLVSQEACRLYINLLYRRGNTASTLYNIHEPDMSSVNLAWEIVTGSSQYAIPEYFTSFANADIGILMSYDAISFKLLRLINKHRSKLPSSLYINLFLAFLLSSGIIIRNHFVSEKLSLSESFSQPIQLLKKEFSNYTGISRSHKQLYEGKYIIDHFSF